MDAATLTPSLYVDFLWFCHRVILVSYVKRMFQTKQTKNKTNKKREKKKKKCVN